MESLVRPVGGMEVHGARLSKVLHGVGHGRARRRWFRGRLKKPRPRSRRDALPLHCEKRTRACESEVDDGKGASLLS